MPCSGDGLWPIRDLAADSGDYQHEWGASQVTHGHVCVCMCMYMYVCLCVCMYAFDFDDGDVLMPVVYLSLVQVDGAGINPNAALLAQVGCVCVRHAAVGDVVQRSLSLHVRVQ